MSLNLKFLRLCSVACRSDEAASCWMNKVEAKAMALVASPLILETSGSMQAIFLTRDVGRPKGGSGGGAVFVLSLCSSRLMCPASSASSASRCCFCSARSVL